MGAASHSAVPYCGAGDGNHRLSAHRGFCPRNIWLQRTRHGRGVEVEPGERGLGHAEGQHCTSCAHMAGARLLPSVTLCVRA